MQILKSIDDLTYYLKNTNSKDGCLADTGFLYSVAFDDDRLHDSSNVVLDVLAESGIPIYANVVSRMEFIDLMFRKLITKGAIQVFDGLSSDSVHKTLRNILKNIRDQNTAHDNKGLSYKVDESRLKRIRSELEQSASPLCWKVFCENYVDEKLLNEWVMIEDDLGLNFIEIMEGSESDNFSKPLIWSDMVKIMGKHGLRAPDAMIANLFAKSKFPLLITTDSDFEKCFFDPLDDIKSKAIYFL